MQRMLQLDRLERSEIARILRQLFPFPEDMGPHQWEGIQLPKMNRVFPELHAKDIVSVQPMSEPSDTVWYMDIVGYNPFREIHYQQI
jgi:hypothetical protein